jgi:P-loop Domain of unknown function (DUF2791)
MSRLASRDVEHIFEALRNGLVPERGIEAFAVGIEKARGELAHEFELAEAGTGAIKFLRGGYGCGKTFMARLAILDAQARGFATSFVIVSEYQLPFHRFDDVYRKAMTELGTASCPRGALGEMSRLSGTKNVAATARSAAGINGAISSRDALDSLSVVLEIVKASGCNGMLIVIDEVETILRMRRDFRHKSLNGLRQIADAAGSYPGLLWLFTGTPEFFDSRHGVAGLAPLHERIRFHKHGTLATPMQPHVELMPFDSERLRSVALKLCEIYPARDRARLESRVSPEFINRLLDVITKGFRGDVRVVPRQFLRELVTQMDLVDENGDYVPLNEYTFWPPDSNLEEQYAITGSSSALPGDGEPPVTVEDVW